MLRGRTWPQSALRVRARAQPHPRSTAGKFQTRQNKKATRRPRQVFKPQEPGGGFFSAAAKSAEAALGEDHPGRRPAGVGKTRENVLRTSMWASPAPEGRGL